MKPEKFDIYKLGEKEEAELFQKALIFFDTSALLDFYYYSKSTTSEIFDKIFKALKGRIYISNQTEFEFLKNRKTVLQKPITSYDNLLNVSKVQKDSGHIDKIGEIIIDVKKQLNKNLTGQFNTLKEKTTKADKHPFLEPSVYSEFERKIELLSKYIIGFESNFNEFKKTIEQEIESKQKSLKKELDKDQILKQFNKSIVTTKGLNHTEIIKLIEEEGEVRYRNEIPPGYLDEKEKIGFQKYGDLIVWKELLIESVKQEKDAILIINDLKEDWWQYDEKENPSGPRYELIKEYNDTTNKRFWMYSINDFLFKSKKYLDTKLEEKAIEDVKSVINVWPEDQQAIVADLIFTYYDKAFTLEFDATKFDSGVDYMVKTTDRKTLFFQHKKTQKGRYTSVLIPLRNAYYNIPDLKKKYDFNKFVFILESNNLDVIEQLLVHAMKRNPQKILLDTSVNLQFLIVYQDEGSYKVMYDSDSKNNVG